MDFSVKKIKIFVTIGGDQLKPKAWIAQFRLHHFTAKIEGAIIFRNFERPQTIFQVSQSFAFRSRRARRTTITAVKLQLQRTRRIRVMIIAMDRLWSLAQALGKDLPSIGQNIGVDTFCLQDIIHTFTMANHQSSQITDVKNRKNVNHINILPNLWQCLPQSPDPGANVTCLCYYFLVTNSFFSFEAGRLPIKGPTSLPNLMINYECMDMINYGRVDVDIFDVVVVVLLSLHLLKKFRSRELKNVSGTEWESFGIGLRFPSFISFVLN